MVSGNWDECKDVREPARAARRDFARILACAARQMTEPDWVLLCAGPHHLHDPDDVQDPTPRPPLDSCVRRGLKVLPRRDTCALTLSCYACTHKVCRVTPQMRSILCWRPTMERVGHALRRAAVCGRGSAGWGPRACVRDAARAARPVCAVLGGRGHVRASPCSPRPRRRPMHTRHGPHSSQTPRPPSRPLCPPSSLPRAHSTLERLAVLGGGAGDCGYGDSGTPDSAGVATPDPAPPQSAPFFPRLTYLHAPPALACAVLKRIAAAPTPEASKEKGPSPAALALSRPRAVVLAHNAFAHRQPEDRERVGGALPHPLRVLRFHARCTRTRAPARVRQAGASGGQARAIWRAGASDMARGGSGVLASVSLPRRQCILDHGDCRICFFLFRVCQCLYDM
ncbi:hypothetical protein GGX14DRAFT_570807 [Mycena pura]|uniref:Uncharacterized protein n=1 Tax=Mycena pura TaxID=153505 RepID=A0AAD6Y8J6_9AGAR|nr:hypothetical protein GGX14DRAFT_570807 [Mycena pura]